MTRLLTVFVALCLLGPLPACWLAQGDGAPMTVHGLEIDRIKPGHRVVLTDGLVIDGDARLSEALRAGGAGIAGITVLERMPPVFVVTFADGEVRRYRSRRTP